MNDASHPSGYERSDADPRLIAAIASGFVLFLLLAPLLLHALYPTSIRPRGISTDLPRPPAPRLQVDPDADLARLRAEEQTRLTTYGWADRDGRIAHIPISRAIDLLGNRGLPGWPAPASP